MQKWSSLQILLKTVLDSSARDALEYQSFYSKKRKGTIEEAASAFSPKQSDITAVNASTKWNTSLADTVLL